MMHSEGIPEHDIKLNQSLPQVENQQQKIEHYKYSVLSFYPLSKYQASFELIDLREGINNQSSGPPQVASEFQLAANSLSFEPELVQNTHIQEIQLKENSSEFEKPMQENISQNDSKLVEVNEQLVDVSQTNIDLPRDVIQQIQPGEVYSSIMQKGQNFEIQSENQPLESPINQENLDSTQVSQPVGESLSQIETQISEIMEQDLKIEAEVEAIVQPQNKPEIQNTENVQEEQKQNITPTVIPENVYAIEWQQTTNTQEIVITSKEAPNSNILQITPQEFTIHNEAKQILQNELQQNLQDQQVISPLNTQDEQQVTILSDQTRDIEKEEIQQVPIVQSDNQNMQSSNEQHDQQIQNSDTLFSQIPQNLDDKHMQPQDNIDVPESEPQQDLSEQQILPPKVQDFQEFKPLQDLSEQQIIPAQCSETKESEPQQDLSEQQALPLSVSETKVFKSLEDISEQQKLDTTVSGTQEFEPLSVQNEQSTLSHQISQTQEFEPLPDFNQQQALSPQVSQTQEFKPLPDLNVHQTLPLQVSETQELQVQNSIKTQEINPPQLSDIANTQTCEQKIDLIEASYPYYQQLPLKSEKQESETLQNFNNVSPQISINEDVQNIKLKENPNIIETQIEDSQTPKIEQPIIIQNQEQPIAKPENDPHPAQISEIQQLSPSQLKDPQQTQPKFITISKSTYHYAFQIKPLIEYVYYENLIPLAHCLPLQFQINNSSSLSVDSPINGKIDCGHYGEIEKSLSFPPNGPPNEEFKERPSITNKILRMNTTPTLSLSIESQIAVQPTEITQEIFDIPEETDETTAKPMKGYEQDRFIDKIDSFFICRLCDMVVRNPVECGSCQQLLCGSCSKFASACPFGCSVIVPKMPSKFASMVYNRLNLKCGHYQNGCEIVLTIEEIDEHDQNCMYITTVCESPVCGKEFVKKDKFKDEDQALVCSDLCHSVVSFKNVLEGKDEIEVLQAFTKFLIGAKKIVEAEVMEELDPKLKDAEARKKEAEDLLHRKEELAHELDERRKKYHPGKWNLSGKLWTCCGENDKFVIGCRDLQQPL